MAGAVADFDNGAFEDVAFGVEGHADEEVGGVGCRREGETRVDDSADSLASFGGGGGSGELGALRARLGRGFGGECLG